MVLLPLEAGARHVRDLQRKVRLKRGKSSAATRRSAAIQPGGGNCSILAPPEQARNVTGSREVRGANARYYRSAVSTSFVSS